MEFLRGRKEGGGIATPVLLQEQSGFVEVGTTLVTILQKVGREEKAAA